MKYHYIFICLFIFILTGCSTYNIQTSLPVQKHITKPILLNKEYKQYSLNSRFHMYSEFKGKEKEKESFFNTTVYNKDNKKTYKGSIGNNVESYTFKANEICGKTLNTIVNVEKNTNKEYASFLNTLIKKELQKFKCNPSNLLLKTKDKAMSIKDLTAHIKKNPLFKKFIPSQIFYTVEGLGYYEGKEVIISHIDIEKHHIVLDAKTNLNLSFFIKGMLLYEVPYKMPRKYNLKLQFDLYTYKAHIGDEFKSYYYKEKIAEISSVGEVDVLEH